MTRTRISRTLVVGLVALAALTVAIAVLRGDKGRRSFRRFVRRATRQARHQSGRLKGLRYRLAGHHPDPNVEDNVLADRVRSLLGPLEHRLDIPRVHVQAQGHEVLLHGDVSDEEQAREIVDAVGDIPGVHKVQSHLHVGLFAGDSRPSRDIAKQNA